MLARFDAERQALALMDHPNIARVYDGGYTGVRSQESGVSKPRTGQDQESGDRGQESGTPGQFEESGDRGQESGTPGQFEESGDRGQESGTPGQFEAC